MAARLVTGVPASAPHELRRERLLEVLHRHSTRPLILLVAPAGFGKSTLAATYARDSGAVVAWLTLQGADRDSRRLFTRLADALEPAFEEADSAVVGRLPELRRGLEAGSEGAGLARLLLADLAHAPAGFMLIFDDFHVVQDAEDILEAVDTLVRGLPEMGQLVITAREAPPLSMTRLVADDSVFGLGAEDLRFTPEETHALRQSLGGDASHDAEAEGWVTGILLGGAPHQLGIGGGALLGAYVERELLARMRPVEQRWLETLAVLETITPNSAERLLGRGPWPLRLRGLAEQCPFLVEGPDGISYRLHSLVRDSLLNRLHRAGSTRAARAWSVARDLAEESFDTIGVVRACQELGQLERAVTLIRRSVEEAVQAGRWSAALAALDLLPKNVRRAHPDLSMAEAQSLILAGRLDAAREAAEDALHHGGRSGDVSVQIGAIVWLARIGQYAGTLDVAEDWLSAADHLLNNNSELPLDQRRLLEGRALNVRGICCAMRGQLGEATEAFERAERLLAMLGPTRDLALVEHNFGSFCNRTGDYARAQTMLAAAAAQWRVLGDRAMLATTQNVLGDLYLRCGNLGAAGAALTGAAEVARSAGGLRNECWAVISLGQWHRASGRIEDAVAAFDEVLGLAREIGEREMLVVALHARAEAAILQDDLPTARKLLARAQAEAQRLGSDAQLALIDRSLGRLHLAEGAGQWAVSHCETALRRGHGAWGPDERIEGLYWLGAAYLVLGRAQQATDTLEQALREAEAAGGVAPLVGPVAEDARLLQHGLRAGLEPALLGEIEQQAATRRPWSGVPEHRPIELVVVNELPRLEVRLFGNFVLHRDGQLVEASPRKVDRARELLALLVLNANGLPDREIADLLWGEMTPHRALHNLQMAAYMLRRWLGSKAALRFGAGTYQLNPQLQLVADVRTFDASLARAHSANDESSVQALGRAVDVYRGPLLADVAWQWVDPLREAYRARYVAAALRLADLVRNTDLARSDGLAERVIELEPENEAAYERLLLNARARGDALAAHRIARRYEAAATRLGFAANPYLLQAR